MNILNHCEICETPDNYQYCDLAHQWNDDLIRKCVNSHDKCFECNNDCPYCEIVLPKRKKNGRFAKMHLKNSE